MEFKEKVDTNEVYHTNFKYVKDNLLKLDHFKTEVMATRSAAAKGLCDWVINICKYYDVIQDVEPKRKALKESVEQLTEANAKLKIVQDNVRELNEE